MGCEDACVYEAQRKRGPKGPRTQKHEKHETPKRRGRNKKPRKRVRDLYTTLPYEKVMPITLPFGQDTDVSTLDDTQSAPAAYPEIVPQPGIVLPFSNLRCDETLDDNDENVQVIEETLANDAHNQTLFEHQMMYMARNHPPAWIQRARADATAKQPAWKPHHIAGQWPYIKTPLHV